MRKLSVGIVGIGRIGKVHIASLTKGLPGVEVLAVAAPRREKAEEIANQYSIPSVMTDYEDLLSNPAIDAVVICSPTDTHSRYISEAARTGKHIFCEKPIDLSLEAIRDALQEVEKSGVKLMVGFNRRFDPSFMRARNRLQSGDIGKPYLLKITSRDPAPPPLEYLAGSGGIFLDMAIHDFDLARFLLESEIVEVYTRAGVLIDGEIGELGDYDTAITTVRFANGALGVIDNCRKTTYGYDQRVEVFGSKGMVKVDNSRHDSHEFFDSTGAHKPVLMDFFMDRYSESYENEMEAFVRAIRGETELPVSGEDGLRAVAIGLAAKRSAGENRPVKLSEILTEGTGDRGVVAETT